VECVVGLAAFRLVERVQRHLVESLTHAIEMLLLASLRGQSRGGLGIKVAKLSEDRGDLAGGLIVSEDDEVLVVLASGKVVRSDVAEVPAKGRDTMGVVFAKFADDDRIIAIARNSERNLVEEAAESEAAEPAREE